VLAGPCRGMAQTASSGTATGAKRKIGGHFGEALGASTKRRSPGAAAWREEVGDEGEALAGDSDSDAFLDPGTPLPSEPSGDEAGTADPGAVPTSAGENGEAARAAGEPNGDTDAAPGKGSTAAADKEPVVAAVTEPLPNGGDASSNLAPALAVLELLIGGNVTNHSLHVLLQKGYGEAAQRLLAPCATEEGSSIDVLLAGSRCSFGRNDSSAGQQQEAAASSKPSNGKTTEATTVTMEVVEEVAPPEDGQKNGGTAEVLEGVEHCSAGLLTAARNSSPGLVLTLGPQPLLDKTHTVLGPALCGRRALRRLQVLAPLCSSSTRPQIPLALRLAGPPEPTTVEFVDAKKPVVFAMEEPRTAEDAGEELEIAALEVDSRESDISELKGQPFSRERQLGVAKVEEAVLALEGRLEALSGLDETLAGQRLWLGERASHLRRVLGRLK